MKKSKEDRIKDHYSKIDALYQEIEKIKSEGSEHKTFVEGYTDLSELADVVGNLRYDALKYFLACLRTKLAKDAFADERRGREKIAKAIMAAGKNINIAESYVGDAWEIAEPYMNPK